MSRKKTAELKVSLLSKGINFDMNLFKDYPKDFYDNQFVYGKTSSNVKPEHRFPQVLVLGDGIISAVLRRENSPWNLKIEEDEIIVCKDDRYVKTVSLPEKPPYFGKKLSDGTPSESIVAVAGEDTPGFFLYPKCFYFSEGAQCGFCSMKSARKTVGKHMTSDFTEDNVTEATKLFQKTKWRDIPIISVTTGTPINDGETRKFVIKMIKTMHEALEPKIPIHVLAHPPYDLGVLEEYKDAGVTSIAFNLEIFDKKLFEKNCPGKHKFYNYDKWLKALDCAKDTFGEYNVFCGLIWGLEPTESTINGNEYFLERGIGIASNIFHADPQSVLSKHPHPTEEDILQIAEAQDELYLKNQLAKTIFPVSMRSTIDWEVYRGDFR